MGWGVQQGLWRMLCGGMANLGSVACVHLAPAQCAPHASTHGALCWSSEPACHEGVQHAGGATQGQKARHAQLCVG
jgi:hypothetical protein